MTDKNNIVTNSDFNLYDMIHQEIKRAKAPITKRNTLQVQCIIDQNVPIMVNGDDVKTLNMLRHFLEVVVPATKKGVLVFVAKCIKHNDHGYRIQFRLDETSGWSSGDGILAAIHSGFFDELKKEVTLLGGKISFKYNENQTFYFVIEQPFSVSRQSEDDDDIDQENKNLVKGLLSCISETSKDTKKDKWMKLLWLSEHRPALYSTWIGIDVVSPSQFVKDKALQDKVSRNYYQIVLADVTARDLLLPVFDKVLPDYQSFLALSDEPVDDKAQAKNINGCLFDRAVTERESVIEFFEDIITELWYHHCRRCVIAKVDQKNELKILSIADHVPSQGAFKILVERHKFAKTTQSSTDEEEYTKAVAKEPFDLIMLNLGRDKSGLQRILKIKEIQRQQGYIMCPILLETGHFLDIDFIETKGQKGIYKIYHKPYYITEIPQMLSEFVPKRIRLTLMKDGK